MPLYEFHCADCGPFEQSFPMATVPTAADCARCLRPARRVVTTVRWGRGSSPQMRLLDRTARSAHEPDVVAAPPPSRSGPSTAQPSTNPLHRKLPRP
ncbi:zinc ribbon domain-containing protein [Rhodococcus triatomae]|uniref:Putative regulatory protein, FmdB family n=1 Tax=Rhodococcus triatomae TaxID=300028 RepID=A0A1G8RLG0_9NOCA|nr:zinc ribbon domain-containing protein [Rhodococcus triatomae]QNG19912.1 zinc ribbon domain-containing protein [Rhodococcus triatomae]QNG24173.1 zinc ribbon domain-containing protein [Rhodococcus triatomae]SDJ17781.1 putative regulatory protein, FmdB family [Rhodococcus triatomae]